MSRVIRLAVYEIQLFATYVILQICSYSVVFVSMLASQLAYDRGKIEKKNSNVCVVKISQCRTSVLHCCKGDAASQWEMTILGVSELRDP